MRLGWIRFLALTVALAAAYFATAKLGLRLGAVEQVTVVWPPTGIALVAVLYGGVGAVPGLAVGALLANLTAHEPLAVAAGIAVGNTLEALVGAWLLRAVGLDRSLGRLRDVLGLVLLAAAGSTAVSATVGVTSLCLGGVQPWRDYRVLWGVWWLGDAVGDLVVAPLLLTVAAGAGRLERRGEAAILTGTLAAVSLAVFGGLLTGGRGDYPLEYTVFPFVIWAALRFGPGMTAWVTFVASAVAIAGTLGGVGPLARWQGAGGLVLLQTFMGVTVVTGLLLSASVAERRRAEVRRRREHGLLEGITEGTTDAVFVKDQQGRYLLINPAGARFLGTTAAAVLGRDDHGLFSPETAAAIMERDRRVIASGQTQTYEEVGTAAGVTRTYLSTKGPYRDERGRIVGLIGISRDITDRKRLESELERRAAELAEADRRKDEFLAMLAHELRNPLAPVRNAVEILGRPGLDGERLRWARDILERQVRQLTRLVDDLLDVSRITRGKIELRRERVELGSVVTRALEISRPLLDARRHVVEVVPPVAPVWLEADPTRLEQVLANLLNNAAKYTEPGGRVVLHADREGDEALVRVRDTGIGISPEMLGRLFTPFTQAQQSLDRSEGGLGLGLSVARGLVEMHGGRIEAHSAGPGQGSEFVVRLPVADGPTERAGPPADSPTVAGWSRRVLVVDDSRDNADTLAMVLRCHGHEVTVAHDGPTALERARACRPDAVLLDIGLPGESGYEVARRLRREPGLEEVLLVALTGYGQEDDRRRAREAGFDHHLVKPADPEALGRLLAEEGKVERG